MARAQMWVCSSCGGFYWPDVAQAQGKCPGCGGQGSVKAVERDESGILRVAGKEDK